MFRNPRFAGYHRAGHAATTTSIYQEDQMQEIPLTDLRNELADGLFSEKHLEKIERLRQTHHHSIRRTSHQVVDTNCFAYAFGLTDTPARELMKSENIFADSRFIRWLIVKKHITEIDPPADHKCLTFYFLEPRLIHCKHAAIRYPDGRLESKWGTYLVYQHSIEEVPSNYGDHVIFTEKPSNEEADALFAAYVRLCQTSLPSWARPFGN